jgi:hypothetical protein
MPASKEGLGEGTRDRHENLQRAAEYAILLAMDELRARRLPLNSETVPAEAAKRLTESRPGRLTNVTDGQVGELVAEAVARLRADGRIYAPVHPSIFWRRLRG